MIRRDFEEKVDERAEELALQQTGFEFRNLPPSVQIRIWSQAESEIKDDEVTAAEYQMEAYEETQMLRKKEVVNANL